MRTWVRAALHELKNPPVPSNLVYFLDKSALSPTIASKVIEFTPGDDQATESFLDTCYDLNFVTELAAPVLHLFFSLTDTNAILGRGKMFVLSTDQATTLLGTNRIEGSLLDVGAGDGSVTEQISPLVDEIVATEVSSAMVQRLKRRGFATMHTSTLTREDFAECDLARYLGSGFDLITCFNVLDRTDKPLTLLRQMRSLLKANTGKLLITLVLPFSAHVESGRAFKQTSPSEHVLQGRHTFEEGVNRFVNEVLHPLHFQVHVVSRVPYLCQGDLHMPYYTLDDAVFVVSSEDDLT